MTVLRKNILCRGITNTLRSKGSGSSLKAEKSPIPRKYIMRDIYQTEKEGRKFEKNLNPCCQPIMSAVSDPAVNMCSELTTCKDANIDATKCNSVSPPWHFLNLPSATSLKN